ncbi:putative membrane protein [Xanthobacter flavus]|uniref:Membrane protein n=1 Tax=Xanthobacter flavus TaxID=281 RepID=A0A9W6CLP2_XANFL|nr:hypothetical protein [Xanthobacter flavus]MDR6333974.1 putative membrane protein [Xanthobacter flavus]GLI22690.1 hypothetical protein XFLAVUS301_23640 [Xanthobacter flavus]
MSIRLQLAAMLFMMIQAVTFFAALLVLLLSPLARDAMTLMPFVVLGSSIISAPLSWWLAPRLRARTWRREGTVELLR